MHISTFVTVSRIYFICLFLLFFVRLWFDDSNNMKPNPCHAYGSIHVVFFNRFYRLFVWNNNNNKKSTVSTGSQRHKWIDNYSFDWNEMFCICAYVFMWRVCVYVIVVESYRVHCKFTVKYCSPHNIRTDLQYTVTGHNKSKCKNREYSSNCLLNVVHPFDIIYFTLSWFWLN